MVAILPPKTRDAGLTSLRDAPSSRRRKVTACGAGGGTAVSVAFIGVPSMLNFCTVSPVRACATACCTPSWIIFWRSSSRACSKVGGGAVRRSSSLMTCQPNWVCTGVCVISRASARRRRRRTPAPCRPS